MHRHIARLTLYSLITLLVLLALLLSALRLGVQYVGEYRQYIEQQASERLGMPVRIGGLDARLIGFTPSLVLNQITLLDNTNHAPVAEFHHLALSLDLFVSLWRQEPVLRVVISGIDLTIQRQHDGQFSIHGLPRQQPGSDDGALMQWLLEMPRLAIRDSRILWQDLASEQTWQFEDVQLLLDNSEQQHRFKGSLGLPEGMGERLQLAVELDGDPRFKKDWNARFHAKLQALQSTAHKHYQFHDWQLEQGLVDLELWGQWQAEGLGQVEGQVTVRDLRLSSPGLPQQEFSRLSSDFRFQQGREEKSLQIQNLSVQRGDERYPPMQLSIEQQGDALTIQADRLQLAQIHPLLILLPNLDEEQRTLIHQLEPAGELSELHLSFKGPALQAAHLAVHDVTVQANERLPGVQGLSARLDYRDQQAHIKLDSQALSIHHPRLFERPLMLHRSQGDFYLHREDAGWRLLARDIQVNSPDMQLALELQALFDEQSSPLISLQSELQQGAATAVRDFLPTAMPDSGYNWLAQAFTTGIIDQGRVVLHGRLGDFPFEHGEGHFEALLKVRDVSLNYYPEWPMIHEADGEVHFVGRAMQICASHGRIFGARIGETTVSVDDFHQPLLRVEGSASTGAADGLRFLRESPLGRNMTFLRGLEASGDSRLHLQLAIPLSERLHHAWSTLGQIDFHDNHLRIHEGVEFTHIKGQLHFDSSRFQARGISALWYQQPLEIDVVHREGDGKETFLIAHGELEPELLHKGLGYPWLKHLDGKSRWQGHLHIPHHGKESARLYLSTPSQGIASSLPHPLTKPAEDYLPIELNMQLDAAPESTHTQHIGERLAARWRQDKTGQPARMTLTMGSTTPDELPDTDVIQLTGQLEQLDLAAWQNALAGSGQDDQTRLLPLHIKMQNLHLSGSEQSTTSQDSGHRQLMREILIDIDEFQYHDMVLGKSQLRMHPVGDRLRLEDLRLGGEAFQLTGHGHWLPGGRTQMELELESPNLGVMLDKLGFASVVRNGKTRASAKLDWPGSPAAFALANIKGNMNANIEDGTIEDARPGAGKLLGILSLQALPRRLFLDFRDIAETGLQFRRIQSNLRFDAGNAYTEDLSIDSLPAKILISGRTGLVAQDFEQEMVVIPQVRDTVSVAGALTWGPQIGALLIVLQNIFKQEIDAATMLRYRISGSWDKPEIISLDPPPVVEEDEWPW
jgi:uncharacterized protein (TIGR02099 family)